MCLSITWFGMYTCTCVQCILIHVHLQVYMYSVCVTEFLSWAPVGLKALGWVHNIFACVVLRPEVNVNTCCNAGIEKFSIPALRCVATRVQINLYALPVATRRKQNIVNQALYL